MNGLLFVKKLIFFTQGCFEPSLIEIGPVVLKVAHHTWIKFLKSRRNSLMMKNDMTDMNVQKANEKSFFGKNMTFKKLFQ